MVPASKSLLIHRPPKANDWRLGVSVVDWQRKHRVAGVGASRIDALLTRWQCIALLLPTTLPRSTTRRD